MYYLISVFLLFVSLSNLVISEPSPPPEVILSELNVTKNSITLSWKLLIDKIIPPEKYHVITLYKKVETERKGNVKYEDQERRTIYNSSTMIAQFSNLQQNTPYTVSLFKNNWNFKYMWDFSTLDGDSSSNEVQTSKKTQKGAEQFLSDGDSSSNEVPSSKKTQKAEQSVSESPKINFSEPNVTKDTITISWEVLRDKYFNLTLVLFKVDNDTKSKLEGRDIYNSSTTIAQFLSLQQCTQYNVTFWKQKKLFKQLSLYTLAGDISWNLTVENITSTMIEISWNPLKLSCQKLDDAVLKNYTVWVNISPIEIILNYSSSVSNATIEDISLKASTYYSVTIWATYNDVESTSKETIPVFVLPDSSHGCQECNFEDTCKRCAIEKANRNGTKITSPLFLAAFSVTLLLCCIFLIALIVFLKLYGLKIGERHLMIVSTQIEHPKPSDNEYDLDNSLYEAVV